MDSSKNNLVVTTDDNRIVVYNSDDTYTCVNHQKVYDNELNQFKNWQCSAGVKGIYINTKGDIYPAHCFRSDKSKILGNVFEDGNLKVNSSWIQCDKNKCHSGIDLNLPKIKNNSHKNRLFFTFSNLLKNPIVRSNVPERSEEVKEPVAFEVSYLADHIQIEWNISLYCDYDCTYCGNHIHNSKKDYPSTEELLKAAQRIRDLFPFEKTLSFNFGSTGEPTQIPGYLDLIKHLSAQNCIFITSTNFSKDIDFFTELYRYSNINISLHLEYLQKESFSHKLSQLAKEVKKHRIALLPYNSINVLAMYTNNTEALCNEIIDDLQKVSLIKNDINFIPLKVNGAFSIKPFSRQSNDHLNEKKTKANNSENKKSSINIIKKESELILNNTKADLSFLDKFEEIDLIQDNNERAKKIREITR